jgi:hypothetical protein
VAAAAGAPTRGWTDRPLGPVGQSPRGHRRFAAGSPQAEACRSSTGEVRRSFGRQRRPRAGLACAEAQTCQPGAQRCRFATSSPRHATRAGEWAEAQRQRRIRLRGEPACAALRSTGGRRLAPRPPGTRDASSARADETRQRPQASASVPRPQRTADRSRPRASRPHLALARRHEPKLAAEDGGTGATSGKWLVFKALLSSRVRCLRMAV